MYVHHVNVYLLMLCRFHCFIHSFMYFSLSMIVDVLWQNGLCIHKLI